MTSHPATDKVTSGDFTVYTCERHYAESVDLFGAVFIESFPLRSPRECNFRQQFAAVNGYDPGDDSVHYGF